MKVERLLNLVSRAAERKDNIEKGVVGFAGYGFVFREPFRSGGFPYITIQGSSKFCSVGLLLKRNVFQQDLDKKSWKDLLRYMEEEDNYDLLLAGSLKTLIPTLRFGGDELLFHAWVFVKTPDGKQFPATFYYRQSGLSMGGWKSYKNSSGKAIFPKEFESIINFSPFEFGEEGLKDLEGLKALVQALVHALSKVHLSNFHGVYKHEFGQTLMGVRDGRPFSMELYRPMSEAKIKKLINFMIL